MLPGRARPFGGSALAGGLPLRPRRVAPCSGLGLRCAQGPGTGGGWGPVLSSSPSKTGRDAEAAFAIGSKRCLSRGKLASRAGLTLGKALGQGFSSAALGDQAPAGRDRSSKQQVPGARPWLWFLPCLPWAVGRGRKANLPGLLPAAGRRSVCAARCSLTLSTAGQAVSRGARGWLSGPIFTCIQGIQIHAEAWSVWTEDVRSRKEVMG